MDGGRVGAVMCMPVLGFSAHLGHVHLQHLSLLAVAVTTTFLAASHAASAMVIWRAI